MNKIVSRINTILNEKDEESSEYKAFFQKMLKKYNVSSPNELSDDEKKKFFQDVEDGWKKEDPKTDDKDE